MFCHCDTIGLLPLAKGLLKTDVHINATTGSTGAGVSPSETTHFSWRSNNMSHYKAFDHQHLGEINQSVINYKLIIRTN
jgi:N-acetyl-gamma-glutamyl-phosphate reductase